jgi:hypothetical protein
MGRHSLNHAAGIALVWLPVLGITAVVTSRYAPTPLFPCCHFCEVFGINRIVYLAAGRASPNACPGCTITSSQWRRTKLARAATIPEQFAIRELPVCVAVVAMCSLSVFMAGCLSGSDSADV